MLDAHFSHLYFCQSLHTLQRGLPATAGLLLRNDDDDHVYGRRQNTSDSASTIQSKQKLRTQATSYRHGCRHVYSTTYIRHWGVATENLTGWVTITMGQTTDRESGFSLNFKNDH